LLSVLGGRSKTTVVELPSKLKFGYYITHLRLDIT